MARQRKQRPGWFAESDKAWQPESADRAVEVVVEESEVVLRVRLLDWACGCR